MVRDTYHFEHSPKKINYVSNFMTTNESRMVFKEIRASDQASKWTDYQLLWIISGYA